MSTYSWETPVGIVYDGDEVIFRAGRPIGLGQRRTLAFFSKEFTIRAHVTESITIRGEGYGYSPDDCHIGRIRDIVKIIPLQSKILIPEPESDDII